MKKIAEKPWNYTVYQDKTRYKISVVCGGVSMYEIEFYLNSEEEKKMEEDRNFLDSLADSVRENPALFLERK